MTDLFDTSNVTDTPEYWASLSDRTAARAVGATSGVEWLARSRAGWIGAYTMLAASIVFLVFATSRNASSSSRDEWSGALAPSGDVARAMLTRAGPPRVESLVFPSRVEAR